MKRLLVLVGAAIALLVGSAAAGGKVEIEGVVSDKSGTCPSITFTIAGTKIMTTEATRFEDGKCSDVVNGRKVEIEGEQRDDKTLRARKVDLD